MAVTTSLWYRFGSISFVAALSILCLKSAPSYYPFALLSFIGYASISLLKKRGLLLSFALLFVAVILFFPSHVEKMWLSVFLMTLSLSWALLYFQKEQDSQFLSLKEASLETLNSEVASLKQQLLDAKEHAQSLQAASEVEKNQAQEQFSAEKEMLSQALQQAQGRLYVETCVEPSVEEALRFEQLEHQHKILKTHFEEKSSILDETRKELFKMEGALHLLLSQEEEEKLTPSEEIRLLTRDLIQLENKCSALESQIESLQELTSLLIPFAKTRLQ